VTFGPGARGRSVAALVLLAALLDGCSPPYVLRAAYEEARLLWRRRPISEVLKREENASVRDKLLLVLAAREFARQRLGLAVGGSYSSLSRVDANQVVYVVSAAPRDRIEPYTWWFPIVGRVPYRGYFDREDALGLAAELEASGHDTLVRDSIAFSTLGWFDDPLLSNLLRTDSVQLIDVVLHELLHNTIYVPGRADFNESFANFVGMRGAVAFFADRGDVERARRAVDLWCDALTFSRRLEEVVGDVGRAYAAGKTDEDERRSLLEAARIRLNAGPWRTDAYGNVARLDNAVLVNFRLYYRSLGLFERLHVRGGALLPATIRQIRSLAVSSDDPFRALGDALAGAPVTYGCAAPQGSIASRRRIPTRIEASATRRMSPATALNEVKMPTRESASNGAPVSR
jgi:predicted aminopeptidase